jgi:UDP-N-acetyl-D-mannosaminuronate dehydrogenase
LLGISYKKDVNDTRESPARSLIEQITSSGGKIKIYDPYAEKIETKSGDFFSELTPEDAVLGCDAIILFVNHTIFTEELISNLIKSMEKPLVIDCKNILKNGLKGIKTEGVYLGIGKPKNAV